MNVSEAVKAAKNRIVELFNEEGIADVGLEEVSRDDRNGIWRITIGFTRPWNRRPTLFMVPTEQNPSRSMKVVKIDDENGEIVSVSNWPSN